MYGVMTQHEAGRGRSRARDTPPAQECAPDKGCERQAERRRRGLREKLIAYVKRRLDPEPEEEPDEVLLAAAAAAACRHRPEELAKLAQLTNFSRKEIKLIYRGFKQECPTGMVDEDGFKHIFAQFFPQGDATQYAHYVFNTIEHKQSGKVNFEEFLLILSRVSRGSVQEKLSWVFALYDVDGDGRISRQEMLEVVSAIYDMLGRATAPAVHDRSAREHVDKIFHLIDRNKDGVVTPDELAEWCSRDPRVLSSFDNLDSVL